MTKNAILEPKLVGEISGNFIIPAYQRGYRWEKEHIEMLLNDIYENGAESYSLQPIVVKKLQDGSFELIDGQQRLTSIFLILKYMKQLLPTVEHKFSIKYTTRERSEDFLESLDEIRSKENIDFYHIYNAYTAIEEWFTIGNADKLLKGINLYKYFSENVKVIWYEVENNKDSTALFTRLNIGKIPLTNAELVKALFLSKDTNHLTDEKQLEIATTWDAYEKELHDKSYWAFLTNEKEEDYPTRIELIFNMIAKKAPHEKEKFYTFYHFSDEMKTKSKVDIWKDIQEFYLKLREWFENRDIYHKVGYLITQGANMQELINESKDLSKSAFNKSLNSKIVAALDLSSDQLLGLSYDKTRDRSKIENLLLLLNVETVRLLQDSSERYSFKHHKRNFWSLEHIHAQNSEGLNKQVDQQLWLQLHKNSLKRLVANNINKDKANVLIQNIEDNYDDITKEVFDKIFADVVNLLSMEDDRSYIDSVSNMALLSIDNNAALNNSTFDVKRNKILEMDRKGKYIPICTRRVFLKYYSESENNQLQFWGEGDRDAYIDAMLGNEGILTPYLKPSQNSENDE
ncbi:DUF262 domain-containing protein [uncultured Draconibacterium sp.]|uniref:DUF262 domain-containing protein n=1 Tax=uncultured Draconibacterium sp. TaxID=1573823 RepID=UPI003217671F